MHFEPSSLRTSVSSSPCQWDMSGAKRMSALQSHSVAGHPLHLRPVRSLPVSFSIVNLTGLQYTQLIGR